MHHPLEQRARFGGGQADFVERGRAHHLVAVIAHQDGIGAAGKRSRHVRAGFVQDGESLEFVLEPGGVQQLAAVLGALVHGVQHAFIGDLAARFIQVAAAFAVEPIILQVAEMARAVDFGGQVIDAGGGVAPAQVDRSLFAAFDHAQHIIEPLLLEEIFQRFFQPDRLVARGFIGHLKGFIGLLGNLLLDGSGRRLGAGPGGNARCRSSCGEYFLRAVRNRLPRGCQTSHLQKYDDSLLKVSSIHYRIKSGGELILSHHRASPGQRHNEKRATGVVHPWLYSDSNSNRERRSAGSIPEAHNRLN